MCTHTQCFALSKHASDGNYTLYAHAAVKLFSLMSHARADDHGSPMSNAHEPLALFQRSTEIKFILGPNTANVVGKKRETQIKQLFFLHHRSLLTYYFTSSSDCG